MNPLMAGPTERHEVPLFIASAMLHLDEMVPRRGWSYLATPTLPGDAWLASAPNGEIRLHPFYAQPSGPLQQLEARFVCAILGPLRSAPK
jgi:hypothetical protein